jgi:hypothetical protein
MPTRDEVEGWMTGYVTAWTTNLPEDIGALFTEDAVYFGYPFDTDAWSGRDGIVAGWLDHRDEPEEWEFTWRILGIDGDTAFVQGEVLYVEPTPSYDSLWVLRFDGDRVREFTEWLHKRD